MCYEYGWLSNCFGETQKAHLELRYTPYFRNPRKNCKIWEEPEYTTSSKYDRAVAKSCQPCEETGPPKEMKLCVSVGTMWSFITSWGNHTSRNARPDPHFQMPALPR